MNGKKVMMMASRRSLSLALRLLKGVTARSKRRERQRDKC